MAAYLHASSCPHLWASQTGTVSVETLESPWSHTVPSEAWNHRAQEEISVRDKHDLIISQQVYWVTLLCVIHLHSYTTREEDEKIVPERSQAKARRLTQIYIK